MNFSTDRDLLAIEPNVFGDVALLSQQRLRVTDGVVADATLSAASADFAAAGVEAGCVVLIGPADQSGVPHEVIARSDAHTLTVSLLRSRLADDPVAGPDGSNLLVIARTFAPQAALVHDLLLRMIGIEPDDTQASLNEDAIVSLSVMARLEALGVLERAYSAAATVAGDNEEVWKKATWYRERFGAACDRATVLLDADGDGRADLRRAPSLVNLVRL